MHVHKTVAVQERIKLVSSVYLIQDNVNKSVSQRTTVLLMKW